MNWEVEGGTGEKGEGGTRRNRGGGGGAEREKEKKRAGRREVVYLRVCFTVYSDTGLNASGCWFPLKKEQWLASMTHNFRYQPKGHPKETIVLTFHNDLSD